MIDKQLQEISLKLSNVKDYIQQLKDISHNICTTRNYLEQLIIDIDDSESMIDDIIFNLEDIFEGDQK